MPFQPNVNDELTIDGITYRIAEHPSAPGIPYGQEGRAGIVYQLLPSPTGRGAGGEGAALKVFKPRFRLPFLVSQAEKLAAFADLPGLRAAQRTVLTPSRHADLLRREPDLTYAVLMPWIEGPTWFDVLTSAKPLSPETSLSLARSLAETLMRMEEQGLAHCDLSAPNVLLPALAHSPLPLGEGAGVRVELVDLEGLYAPGMVRPQEVSSGSAGYAHKQAVGGLWAPEADRFAGAVLLAEMLAWCDPSVVQAAWGESYFDPDEMQQDTPRFRALVDVLERRWGSSVASLFERAWRSDSLLDCPTFGEWLVSLPERPVGQAFSLSTNAAVETTAEQASTSPEEVTLGVIRGLMQAARRMEDKGNLENALELYRQALELAQADPSLRSLAQEIELTVQDVEKRAAVVRPSPLRPPVETPAPPVSPLPLGEGLGVRVEETMVSAEPRPHRRRPWAWALAGGLVLILLALGGLWVLGQRRLIPTPAPTYAGVAGPATAIATATPTPLSLFVLTGTPVPQPVAAISPQNAEQVVQLAHWSQDRVSDEDMPGWSPQGTWLFVPSTMGVRLYSADNFTNYRLIETGKHPVFSPDEKFIASAVNPPGTIRLTDVQSGNTIKEWQPHDAAITDLCFDGDILFSRDENDVIVASDFSADPPVISQVQPGESHTNNLEVDGLLLEGVIFDENEGIVVVRKNNGEVVAQNPSGQEISTLGIYTDPTSLPNVDISPLGKYVRIDNEIRRVQDGQVIATGETLAHQLGWDYPVDFNLVSFSPDERYLAVRESHVALLLNLENREIHLLRLPETGMATYSVPTFRPDSQEVMFPTIGPGVSIPVFSTADGSVRGEIDANSGSAVLRMAFTSAGDLAVLYPAELQVRSLRDGQILQTIRHNAGLDIALMEDGLYSKNDSPDYDKAEYIFTPYNTQQSSRKMAFQRVSEEAGYNFTHFYLSLDVSRGPLFAFSPNHRYLIREASHRANDGSDESIVVLYEADHPDPLRTTLPRPGGGAFSELLFAPDSSLLAIGLKKEVILLSVPDMNIVGQQTTENEITGLAFAPDGKTIAITTESAQVLLWNFETGTLERLDTQAEENRTPTFSADGRLLAIIVPGGIQLWDVSTKQLLHTLEAPAVVSLAFSPDQKFLVAGVKQDVIYLWGVR